MDECLGHAAPRVKTKIGVEIPLPWTASGRLLVDHLDVNAIRALVPDEDFAMPDGTQASFEGFITEVAEARARGRYENRLVGRTVHCLAAPVRNRRGVTSVTLCFVVPLDADSAHREDLLDVLTYEADRLSREL